MVTILNNSFETWSGGTSFPDPSDGTQLADNWFWHKGAVVPSVNIHRDPVHPYQGSYSMVIIAGTSGSGPNTNTYVYQDLSGFSSLLGQTIIISGALFTLSDSTGVSGSLFIDDGVTPPTFSGSNPLDATYHIVYATKTISMSATRVRIGILPNNYGLHALYVDWINFGTVLNLPEFSFLGDTVKHSPLLQPLDESVRIDEWVNLQLLGPNQWTNSDNNNQFPPQP